MKNRVLLAAIGLAVMGAMTTANASYEDDNQDVHCGGLRVIPGQSYWLSYDFLEGDGNGRSVEGCGEDDAALQGRVYVTDEDGGAVGADGEHDTPFFHGGWTRVNGDGSITCYDGAYDGGDPDSKEKQGNFRNLDCAFTPIQ